MQVAAAKLAAVEVHAAPLARAPTAQPEYTVTKKDIERINVINTEDVVKYVPNLWVRKRFIGDDNAILNVRGTSVGTQSAESLLFADGLLLSNLLGNSYSYAPVWYSVPPDDVAGVTVLYGPYSAELSGNSIGGAVRLHTRKVERLETDVDASVFWQDFCAFHTDHTYFGSRQYARLADRIGRVTAELSVNLLKNTGQPMTFLALSPGGSGGTAVTGAVPTPGQRGPVYGSSGPTDVLSQVVNLMLGYDFGHGWSAQWRGSYWHETQQFNAPESYLRDTTGQPVYQGDVTFDGDNYTVRGLSFNNSSHENFLNGLTVRGPVAGFDVRAVLSTYRINDDQTRKSNDYVTGTTDGAGKLTWSPLAGWDNVNLRAERVFGNHDLSFGLWYDRYFTEQSTYALTEWRNDAPGNSPSNAVRGKTSTQAFWIQDQWTFAPDWSLTPGVRLENWRAYDGGVGAATGSGGFAQQNYAGRHSQAVSPKLALSWAMTQHWSTTLSYGHAVRFPTVGELFQGSLDSLGNFNPSSFDPNLRPERDDDATLALRWSRKNQQITASVFYSRLRDTIFQQVGISPVTGAITYSFLNISRQRNTGATLVYEGHDLLLPGLDLTANLNYTDARILEDAVAPAANGNRLPRVPYWRGSALLGYRFLADWEASLGYRYGDTPSNSLTGGPSFNTFGYTTRYSVVDARLNWKPIKALTLSVGIDNLTDDRYWVYHPYPGRTYLLEAAWKPQW